MLIRPFRVTLAHGGFNLPAAIISGDSGQLIGVLDLGAG